MATTLGIDPSLRRTGIACFNWCTGYKWVAIKPPSKLRGAARLHYIAEELKYYISEEWTRDPIELTAIEGYSYQSVGRLAQLGELGGVIRYLLYQKRVPVQIVAPSQLKKYITGKGVWSRAEGKQTVISAVNKELKLKGKKQLTYPENSDEADALGLTILARALAENQSPKDRAKMEVLQALRDLKK